MATFCPLIKDECRKTDCVLWADATCLLVPFLRTVRNTDADSSDETEDADPLTLRPPEEIVNAIMEHLATQDLSLEELGEVDLIDRFWEERGVETWNLSGIAHANVKKANAMAQKEVAELKAKRIAEVISEEKLNAFADEILRVCREGDRSHECDVEHVAREYLEEKGIDWRYLDRNVRRLVNAAVVQVQKRIQDDYREALAKEKGRMDELVAGAVAWVQENGLTRFTQADCRAYLLEKEITIFSETEGLLHAKVGQELRKKR
jgi:hypothetical protein